MGDQGRREENCCGEACQMGLHGGGAFQSAPGPARGCFVEGTEPLDAGSELPITRGGMTGFAQAVAHLAATQLLRGISRWNRR